MSFHIVVPQGTFGGWRKDFGRLRLGLLYHSLQCDQRWLFLVRWRRPKVGRMICGLGTELMAMPLQN